MLDCVGLVVRIMGGVVMVVIVAVQRWREVKLPLEVSCGSGDWGLVMVVLLRVMVNAAQVLVMGGTCFFKVCLLCLCFVFLQGLGEQNNLEFHLVKTGGWKHD